MNNPNPVAVQDNSLVDACYSMPLRAKRLLLLAVSKIDSVNFLSAAERATHSVEVNASEWAAIFGGKNSYRDLKEGCENLMLRTVKINVKHGHIREFVIVQQVDYFEEEARVLIKFSDSALVRLVGLLEQFTKVYLVDVAKFANYHSIRLYELIQQFSSTGFLKISVEDFRFAMDCVNSYPAIAELKRRVLFPALEEINEKSPLKISFSEQKKGRKITGFCFVIVDELKTPPKTPQNASSSDFLGEGRVIDGYARKAP